MTIAEEKADAYLRDNAGGEFNMPIKWEVKTAYIAGYQAAERYRTMLMAAVRNATALIASLEQVKYELEVEKAKTALLWPVATKQTPSHDSE